MHSLQVQLCVTPSIPPHPSPIIPNQFQALSDVRSRIKRNAADLSLLQRQLKSIQELTKQVEHMIVEYNVEASCLHRSISSLGVHSINKLPPEVLTLIFNFCRTNVLPIDNDPYHVPRFTFDKAPWTLSWVCKRWRLIVHQTSHLWSEIPGPVELSATVLKKKEFDIVKVACDRSHLSLLRVTVVIRKPHRPTLSPFFNLLLPHFSRIEELTFRLDSASNCMDLWGATHFQFPQVELSSLRSLSLQEWDYPFDLTSSDNLQGIALFFRKMPRLNRMIIRSPATLERRADFSSLGIPWQQLTSVTLQDASLLVVRKVLSSAEQLVSLDVLEIRSFHPYDPFEDADRRVLSHHNLKLLHLEFPRKVDGVQSTDDPELFFDTIALPNLNDLSFTHASPFPSTVLLNFLERSQCSLVNFTFPAVDSLTSLLRQCPSVKRIGFDGSIADRDLNQLSHSNGDEWLLPQLENITFHSPRIENTDSLVNLIQGRRLAENVQNLRRIDLMTISTTKHDDDDELDSADKASDHGWQTSSIFPDHCNDCIDDILTVHCGYELVNDSSIMEKLGTLCYEIETVDIKTHDDVVACRCEATGLLAKLLQIYVYIDEVENMETLYPTAFHLKFRFQQALQRFTHDPWLFDPLPQSWVRAPQADYGIGQLSYVAVPDPTM